uniref:ras association domain-containing protein 8-like isoform X2 n=1 Tax=Monopterus albus TaxID=43700 RepID=UPI0009B3067A|nr:ras association domain-containing protein 8-like isoform X2 [Monopterus albus]
MELKVWVEGVARVVCGLSLNTSCQDVVIALAQDIGQTGRYILIMTLQGNEKQLVADDCPLQILAQLGQLAAEVQFILQRTGPSLSEGQCTPTSKRRHSQPRSSEPESPNHKEPHKEPSSPSTLPRRTKLNKASPETRASPVSFLDTLSSVKAIPSYSSKEELCKQILQQQRKLQELEIQIQALEMETNMLEREISSAPSVTLGLTEELKTLEQQLKQNEVELMYGEHWEGQLKEEMDRERDMHRRLHEIQLSVDDYGGQLKELQASSAHLEQDIWLTAQSQSSRAVTRQPDKALRSLQQEFYNRLQQAEELEGALLKAQWEVQAAEEMLQENTVRNQI